MHQKFGEIKSLMTLKMCKLNFDKCRYLLDVGPRTPNVVALEECGRYPLFVIRPTVIANVLNIGLNY